MDSDRRGAVILPRRFTPALAFLAAAMALAAALLHPHRRDPIRFDAANGYLPMAKRVLAEGWAFMRLQDSLAYAPVSFLWPALLGGDAMTVKVANIALFCGVIALAFYAVQRVHSSRAGIIAAVLLAVAPTLRPFIADALTEPPFLFLVAAWIAAVANRSMAAIVIGGIALGLAPLTRPAAMYFPLLMVAVFAIRKDWRLMGMHAVATGVVGLWVLRNAIAFDFPAVAAGAGASLFLGANPLVDGFDPFYFGLGFDVGAVTQQLSHLGIAGDRLLRGVAITELRDTPWQTLVSMALHKASAFLFVTGAEANAPLLRSWRIALAVLALVAIANRWRSPLVIASTALIAYMVAIHLPVLYHHRYSVGAIDLPLVLLAAIGIAELAAAPAQAAIAASAIVVGVGAGLVTLEPGQLQPHFDRVPSQVVWERRAGVRLDAPGAVDVTIANAPAFHPWDMTMTRVEIAASGTCRELRFRYRRPGDPAFAPDRVTRTPLSADGRTHAIVVGGVPLGMNHEGVLRLEFDCTPPSTVEIGKITIAAPRRATYYREKFLGKK